MTDKKVDLYDSHYSNFNNDVYAEIRKETFTIDFGQNSWIDAAEQDLFIEKLSIEPSDHILDIACGSGGPVLRLAEKTGCQITGVDIHEDGIQTASSQAENEGLTDAANFLVVDASGKLPFEDNTFDVITCIDAINHLPNRAQVLSEWHRVLKPKGRLLFTDPIVVTGILNKEDVDIRASIGYFLFVAEGVNTKLLKNAGFRLNEKLDRTNNMYQIASQWVSARVKRKEVLVKMETQKGFEEKQLFLAKCAKLAKNRSLSRLVYLAIKE